MERKKKLKRMLKVAVLVISICFIVDIIFIGILNYIFIAFIINVIAGIFILLYNFSMIDKEVKI